MSEPDGSKYLASKGNSNDSGSSSFKSGSKKYLLTGEISDIIAGEVGMTRFSSDRYNSDTRANYTWEERRKIYEYITGEEGREYSRIELNHLIMRELDATLQASYDYEFVRDDLKLILEYVENNEPAEKIEPTEED